jgi:hypothetical protein
LLKKNWQNSILSRVTVRDLELLFLLKRLWDEN